MNWIGNLVIFAFLAIVIAVLVGGFFTTGWVSYALIVSGIIGCAVWVFMALEIFAAMNSDI
ncbi:MAG: hypothetical protein EPO23_03185 [Xanthobacteraceae bacterium]|nr:MAG: hypothetical protein EPO23_03185 [Xanthobacteraceae bacterium]